MICVRFVRSPGKDDQQASGMCSITIQESFLGWRYEYGSNMHIENDWESGNGWGHPGRVWRVRRRRVYKTLEAYWYIKSGRRLHLPSLKTPADCTDILRRGRGSTLLPSSVTSWFLTRVPGPSVEKKIIFNKWCWDSWCAHAEEWSWTPNSHHRAKWTPNGAVT